MDEPEVTTTFVATVADSDPGPDGFFIGGMICVALGVIFVIIAIIYLIVWCSRNRRSDHNSKQRRKHLQHMKYLEEYSIKAGDSPNDVIKQNNNVVPVSPNGDSVFQWQSQDLVNMGYVSEDTLEKLSQGGPKGPKLEAHMNASTSSYNQRSVSQTGSLSSRQNSVSSMTEVTGSASSGLNRNGVARKATGGSTNNSGPDRLADVPV